MPILFRQSIPQDSSTLLQLWRDSVQATHDFLCPDDFKQIKSMMEQDYFPNVPVWVAIDDQNTVLGFMGLTNTHIDSLFIAVEQRNKGLGRRFIDFAQSKVSGSLSVDVNEQNSKAIGFYQAMGFKVFDRSECDDQGRPYPLLHMRRC